MKIHDTFGSETPFLIFYPFTYYVLDLAHRGLAEVIRVYKVHGAMPFSAINTYEQELKQRNERHTLELQLEQAMQVYQEGLNAQRLNKLEEAHECYTKVFKFDVLKPKNTPEKQDTIPSASTSQPNSAGAGQVSAKSLQLGPAIRLRAMVLKNFALLLLSFEDLDTSMINKALEYLSEALYLVGTNDKEKIVLPSLISVAWALGLKRIARMGLEILVQSDAGSALIPLDEWSKSKALCKNLFGPRTIEYLLALDYVDSVLRDEKPSETPKLLLPFSKLSSIGSQQESLKSLLDAESSFEISLTAKSWSNLISSLTDAVDSASKRNKRKAIKDAYAWSNRDLWRASFVGNPIQPKEVLTEEGTTDTPDIELHKDEKNQTTEDIEMADHSFDEARSSMAPESPDVTPQTPIPHTPTREASEQPEEDKDEEKEAEESSTPKSASKDNETTKISANTDTSNREDTPENDYLEMQRLVASPVKRRRIDRMKRSTLALPADFGLVDSSFAAQFNSYLSLVDSKALPIFSTPANLFLDPSQDIIPELLSAAKLRELLSGWDARESSQFLSEAASAKPQKAGIMSKLQKGESGRSLEDDLGDDEDDLHEESILEESAFVDKFIAENSDLHVQQVRLSLGRNLLRKLASGGQKKLFGESVLKFINEIESLLWSQRNNLEPSEIIMIFALYANSWIRTKSKDIEIFVSRWMSASSINPSLPHAWITAFVNQESEDSSPESSVSEFDGILTALIEMNKVENTQFAGLFAHLSEIPTLSVCNLHMQISKFKAAAAFERVLTPPASAEDDLYHKDDILLLEAMLMPENHEKPESTPDSEFEAIQNFLGFAQPQFKMGLWYNLLEKYEASGNYVNSFLGLTRIFLEGMRSLELGEPLLPVLSVAHDVGKRLLPLLEKNNGLLADHWTLEESMNFLEQAVKLLQTLHLFLLYDDAINSNLLQKPITPSWPKALLKFRELVVMWWCIFYRFWLRCVPAGVTTNQETVNDILSIIHERLGNLGYCGVANGCLLNLHFREIARLNWDGSSLDFSQCLKCKFGLSLSMNGEAANHHTVATKVTFEEADLLLPYAMRLILHHRSFQQTMMRMDTRAVIDEFSKAYSQKPLTTRHEEQVHNIEAYFEQDFSPKLFKRAWSGQGDPRIGSASNDDAHGVWLVQAGVMMNQYRIRRRQAYAASSIKTDALLSAISLYIKDLAASPTRLESWVGIAQAYLYICEDCLTFSGELSIENTPSVYCKKALLAACQAISLQVSDENPGQQRRIAIAQKESFELARHHSWQLLGYLLMLATMPPLARQPLIPSQRPLHPLLVELPSNQTIRLGIVSPSELSSKTALKISLRCLSEHSDSTALWVNLMHRTRVAYHLGSDPLIVLGLAIEAKEASPSGVFDADVEILNFLWDYYRTKKLDSNTVRKWLDKIGPSNEEEIISELALIQSKLRWLLKKNKWLHKPWYILAKIQELDFGAKLEAQNELMHLFSLKSPSKPLTIWNADSDLPGEHGVYIAQYVKYMADLMYANRDTGGLLLMARRFRRLGADMWDHQGTYDALYSQTCSLAHQLIPGESTLKGKYSETLMSELSEFTDRFDIIIKRMSAELEQTYNEDDKWTHTLYYATEVRRLHFGSSSISQADELLIVVFLIIVTRYTEKHREELMREMQEENPPQNGKTIDSASFRNFTVEAIGGSIKKPEKTERQQPRKKIIRKDIINAAQQYIKTVQPTLAKLDDIRIPDNLA